MRILTPDLCVIGAGAGGLAVAAGAALLGADVVLVERGRMGGECLNVGCIPSKALLAAAGTLYSVRGAGRFGIRVGEPEVDFAAVMRRVRATIAAISPQDSAERFEALGVTVVREHGRFTGPAEVAAGEARIRARRFVIATGSTAAVPPLSGLADVPYLTNETLFDLTERPRHLLVLGGGPVGCEMGQAFRALGSSVTLVDGVALLGRDDPELVDVVRLRLRRDGVDVREGRSVTAAAAVGDGVGLTVAGGEMIAGSHLLIAAGRRPTLDNLGLDAAGVVHAPDGVAVDARLRSSNRRVFAIGDAVAGGPRLTHMAAHHAEVVLKNALFHLPARVRTEALPWVTYTSPELAQVGLTEAAARRRHGDRIRILRWPFSENDRARAELASDGLIKVVTDRRGRILGAGVVGEGAGETIQPWVLAMSRRLSVSALASMIAPYPTRGEINRRVAGTFYARLLFSPRVRKLVRFLSRFEWP